MGVALAGPGETAGGPVRRDELFDYLAEEVLDRLDPEIRAAIVDSSVLDALTAELTGTSICRRTSWRRRSAPAFSCARRHRVRARTIRCSATSCASGYSSCERTGAGIPARSRRESLSAHGLVAQAIEHWLAAGSFEPALAALSPTGAGLVRTSPGTVRRWLDAMPSAMRREPAYLLLDAQLLWGAGYHQQVLEPLRAAISGYRAADDIDGEWLARVFLVDSLVFIGAYPRSRRSLPAGRRRRARSRTLRPRRLPGMRSSRFPPSGRSTRPRSFAGGCAATRGAPASSAFSTCSPRRASVSPGATHAARSSCSLGDQGARAARRARRAPVRDRPDGGLLRTLGDRDSALEWIDRCLREAARVGLGFSLYDFRLQRATLLAQVGELSAAESELARAGERSGSGWRGLRRPEAEAQTAILRGDAARPRSPPAERSRTQRPRRCPGERW